MWLKDQAFSVIWLSYFKTLSPVGLTSYFKRLSRKSYSEIDYSFVSYFPFHSSLFLVDWLWHGHLTFLKVKFYQQDRTRFLFRLNRHCYRIPFTVASTRKTPNSTRKMCLSFSFTIQIHYPLYSIYHQLYWQIIQNRVTWSLNYLGLILT